MRAVGVWDEDAGVPVKRGGPGWGEYVAWLNAGNAPDPEPAPAVDYALAARKAAYKARVALKDSEVKAAGVTVANAVFLLDRDEFLTLLGLVGAGALPAGFGWRDKTGTFRPLNMAQARTLAQLTAERDYARRKRLWELHAAINASPNPDLPGLEDGPNPDYVDINTGWPP